MSSDKPMAEQQNISDELWAPLDGVRVLDVTTMFSGAVMTSWMADYGAEVVKVEHPKGDPLRAMSSTSPRWETLNRSKEAICLDLGAPDGAALFRELAPHFDVIVEGFRPGRLESWGIDPWELVARSPRMVICRLSGFGQTGPSAGSPAYGTVLECYSSFALSMGGEDDPPVLPSYGFGDHVGGVFGAFGVMMALMEARKTGRGRVLDLSLFEPLMSLMLVRFTDASATGQPPVRLGNRGQMAAPRSVYPASDGWLGISIASDELFAKLASGIGMPELAADPKFMTNSARVENVEDLDDILSAWTRRQTRAEAVAILDGAGAPAAPVLNALELLHDEHARARGTFVPMLLDDGRVIDVPRAIPRALTADGRAMGQRAPTPGRPIGADTDAVLRRLLDLDDTTLDRLRSSKVIR